MATFVPQFTNPNPIDPSVVGKLAPPQQTSLGDMLNIARGTQAYQQQAQAFPVQLETAQTELQLAKERNPELIKQAKETTKQTTLKTQQEYQEAQNRAIAALSSDPVIMAGKDPKEMAYRILRARDMAIESGVPKEQAEIASAQLIGEAYRNPASVSEHLGNIRRTQMSPESVQAGITGQQQVGGTDIAGNPTVYTRNVNTGQIEQRPLPVSGAPTETMKTPLTETAASVEQLKTKRNELAQGAGSVNQGVARADEILDVLDNMAQGKFGEALGKLSSVTGYVVPAGEESATARAIVQKDIAGLAGIMNAATGGKHAASLDNAIASLADPNAPDAAIRASILQIKPVLLHVQNMNNGWQKVVEKTNGDIKAQRLFDTEMANAYDPKAVLAIDAMNKGTLADYLKNMSAEERKKIKAKAEKYENLINGNL